MFLIKIPQKIKANDCLIEKWSVEEGKSVKKGDILLFIKTSDEIVEIKSPENAALLKIFGPAGSVVAPGGPIGILGQPQEDVAPVLRKISQAQQPRPQPQVTEKMDVSTRQAKPLAQKEEKMTPQPKPAIPAGKVVPIVMPQAGQTMEEGTLLAWKVKEGDRIQIGQIIFEIETDKATMEVEAVDAGRLAKIVVPEGRTVDVKTPVAYLAEDDGDVESYLAALDASESPAESPQAAAGQAVSETAFQAARSAAAISESGRVKASPAARKIAAQRGMDLSALSAGSGPGGRILSADVEGAKTSAGAGITHSLSRMRRAIAGNLLYSKQNIPHFYAKLTVDAAALYSTYKQTKEKFQCSVNDFVTRACAKAIQQYPAFRSRFQDKEIIELPDVNIGIAVGTDEGLTVPVVLKADKMSLKELAERTRQVVAAAREGKLEGIGQGIFTITNLGMFGVEEFSAIINPPESAILAVGAIREGVKVENGNIKPTRLMTLTLSSDHRVIDGVLSAKFLQTLKELLENPQQLL